MKKTILTALAITVAVGGLGIATSVAAHARQGNAQSFEQFDADGNGAITAAEMEAFAQAKFDTSDLNSDGFLDMDELQQQFMARQSERMGDKMGERAEGRTPPPLEMMVGRMMDRLDANDDGMLGPDEMSSQRNGDLFAKADTDGDGSITLEEWDNMPRKGPRGPANN